MKKIKLIPINFRPRERLIKYGAEILSLDELIAVILITGNKTKPLSKIASEISLLIKKGDCSKENLLNIKIGQSKTAQILAVLELSKRLFDQNTITINSAKQIFGLSYEIVHQEKESILCFYLDGQQKLIKKEIVAIGSLNKAHLLPRDIFGLIKNMPVASIILVHNHPSGNMEPSKNDLLFTQRVKLAGDIVGIRLLDHYIVSKNGWNRITP